MTQRTRPLREEHRKLLPSIERLRTTADSLAPENAQSLKTELAEAYRFLALHLIPHAKAEDEVLYRVTSELLAGSEVTAPMTHDHAAVVRLAEELRQLSSQLDDGAVTSSQLNTLRRVLYGLYALITVHFAKEEEIYLPVLDERLSPAKAEALFNAMERSEHAFSAAAEAETK